MKPQTPTEFAGRSRLYRRGFSLVITLMMMVLLTIIALGLLSLSTISLRSSAQDVAQAQAKANAKMALMLAIGQLQSLAGVDTRATAPAAQSESDTRAGGAPKTQTVNQPRWVGVWPTTVKAGGVESFLIGRHSGDAEKLNYLMDLRNSTTPSSGTSIFDSTRADFGGSGQLGWLVSTAGSVVQDPKTFASDPATSSVMLGQSWESSSDPNLKKKAVRAPLVRVKGPQNQDGGYAYWISDDSQKANIAVDTQQKATSPNSLAVAQTAQADLIDSTLKGHGDLTRATGSPLRSLVSYKTGAFLPLSSGAPALASKLPEFVHDLTTNSIGLLTNPQTGGFQQDLSAFLARSETINSTTALSSASIGFSADTAIGTPPLSIGTPLVYGARHSSTSPRFGALKAWADLAKTVSGTGAGASIAATTPPYTTGHPYKGPDITRIAAQAIHPIMTEFSVGFDFTPFTAPQTGRPATNDGMRFHMYPRVTLWNPYNVAINVPAYLAVMRFDPRVNLTMRGTAINAPYYKVMTHYAYPYMLSMVEEDENLTSNCMAFMTEATTIQPGQSLVFTPDPSKGTGLIGGSAMKYNSKALEKNVLTCKIPPGQENFYADLPIRISGTNANKFLGVPKTGSNSTYSWSYENDVGMYYQLRSIPSGMGNNVTISAINSSFPCLQYVVPNAWGTEYYNYEKMKAGDNSEGQPFEEYGLRASRHQQSTWRIGVRMRYFDESREWASRTNNGSLVMGAIPFSSAWGQYNLRGGHVHTSWLGANVNYTDSSRGNAWEWNPGGNYINIRDNIPNDDARMQAVPNSSGQFTMPPFGTSADLGAVQSFVFYDVPRSNTPIASLAQFQNAELSYQNYQAGNVVAWSFQDPRSDRAATVLRPGKAGSSTTNAQDDISKPNRWHAGHAGLIQKGNGQTDDILLYDMAYEVNHRLFDNYFLSTIPYTAAGTSWNRKDALPNNRIRSLDAFASTVSSSTLGSLQTAFHRSAMLLGNYGAFNVNSTSVDAWVAHLSGIRGLKRDAISGSSSADSPFSRLSIPGAMGSGAPSNWQDPAAWNASRGLSDGEIRQLATAIVEEVKLRGPFLSLSDFVNRRLVEAPASASSLTVENPANYSLEATGRYGTLDAAIKRAGLNASLETMGSGALSNRLANCEQVITSEDLSKGYIAFGSQPDFKTIGLPGYLTQGDLLSALAPTLTARGDTFTVRAYGDSRDATGKIVARIWCEAVVQRMPDYIDTTNIAAMRALTPVSSFDVVSPQLRENPSLSAVNKLFGRRFEIVSFRWLNPSEV